MRLGDVAGSVEPVHLSDVPLHPQEAHYCGPASLLTLLEASGAVTDYDSVVERVYVPGLEGSLQVELLAAARGFGRIAYALPPDPEAVLAEVAAGRPVLVLLNMGLPKAPVWHYAVVVGFDPARNRLLLQSGRETLSRQRAPSWLRRWNWAGRWAMVLLRPGEWPASPERERLLGALAAFEDAGGVEAVARAWQTAAEQWPQEPLVWLGLGNAAYRGGDWQEARHNYRQALALAPELLPARINLALAFEDEQRPCEGLRSLGRLLLIEHPLGGTFADLEERLRAACGE